MTSLMSYLMVHTRSFASASRCSFHRWIGALWRQQTCGCRYGSFWIGSCKSCINQRVALAGRQQPLSTDTRLLSKFRLIYFFKRHWLLVSGLTIFVYTCSVLLVVQCIRLYRLAWQNAGDYSQLSCDEQRILSNITDAKLMLPATAIFVAMCACVFIWQRVGVYKIYEHVELRGHYCVVVKDALLRNRRLFIGPDDYEISHSSLLGPIKVKNGRVLNIFPRYFYELDDFERIMKGEKGAIEKLTKLNQHPLTILSNRKRR